jgi:hypothetical protein
MALTDLEALTAYARTMNNLNVDPLEPLLADDFIYESQHVFSAVESKQAFLEYIRPKLQTIKEAGVTVFAEIGSVTAYGVTQPCVVLAQNDKNNLVALVLAQVRDDRLCRLDLCIVPEPHTAERSGNYPT